MRISVHDAYETLMAEAGLAREGRPFVPASIVTMIPHAALATMRDLYKGYADRAWAKWPTLPTDRAIGSVILPAQDLWRRANIIACYLYDNDWPAAKAQGWPFDPPRAT